MTQMLLGINLLLIIVMWVFIVRPSLLDHHRDQLFDLRDEVRTRFVSEGWDLDTPLYQHLRDLLNGHLRLTEEHSFSQFVVMQASLRDKAEAQEWLKQRVEKHLRGSNPAQQAFVMDIRHRSVQILLSYIVSSSGPLMIATTIVFPIFLAMGLMKLCQKVGVAGINSVSGTISGVKRTLSRTFSASSTSVGNAIFKEDFIERCSYTRAFGRESLA
ncbi:hypothetical protein [Cupriavidus basilensis]|uniref:hypothetical protein n=1 Tax=Cupriavidus basilensis TaxID=68895 RepID=UPI00283D4DA2|nr:hypothetical protein [Cupriavidus basilensis]MDR3382330.1 hypothetical protein [Cupriavidus basilensis]